MTLLLGQITRACYRQPTDGLVTIDYEPNDGPPSSECHSQRGNSVRKQDLVRVVAEQSGQNESASGKAVNAVFSAIEEALAKGDEVTISGFGSFKVVERSSRQGRNPQTGEPMTIAARKSPVFRPGTQLKRKVE